MRRPNHPPLHGADVLGFVHDHVAEHPWLAVVEVAGEEPFLAIGQPIDDGLAQLGVQFAGVEGHVLDRLLDGPLGAVA